jgi:hypothetical protein
LFFISQRERKLATPTKSTHLQSNDKDKQEYHFFISKCLENISLLEWGEDVSHPEFQKALFRIWKLNMGYHVFLLESFVHGIKLYQIIEKQLRSEDSSNELSHFKKNYSPFNILMSCIMIACKYNDDIPFNNKSWSGLIQMNIMNLNALEIDIIKVLHFEIPRLTEEDWMNNFIPFMTAAPVMRPPK